ncbi:MAG: 30S ribosomal protein S16 [Chlamydiae bacterium RIFCSPHIGHO2_12_FULL_44_59]|nr:MAG: 30S ribosomal protein S16 [Chlamydiae bacterium RIFCSPHIGHO2_01_FULL_44_39]OGN59086.1 MAG: 30S ribosomal protein S16 [Chlamydiae bacterium RIFCSPHIGHO2_02_FULL_45_9]OGN60284.1 MAG: 30S ribosomal protein S16 [Chlamydiae bacterium RIFCSPHIGHO2_12_FULL_44_59]OGN67063.1 MAG: 30S ribosomal protein S16 [Chlamydiae bacterium RIFCSPLOWO2_01_FULL_44_52]OGN67653.1 MAG: 30S ribosomal protein S16 [Chlamydiae bacterium RIFCSPLOWO2_02_FULL_45_22]OGN71356.1 MAG: 30S ribosomal protein S16 [Chlamydiae 
MALVIRMRQQGAKGRQAFRLVVTDSRNPRDGKYLEMLGWYNPFGANDKTSSMNVERIRHWLNHGAQISDRARALVSRHAPEVIQALVQKKQAKQAKQRKKKSSK